MPWKILDDEPAQPKRSGWTVLEDEGYKPTKYGFMVKESVTPDTQKPTVQRDDGALYYGAEQGNTGKAGWFDANGRRVGDAPGDLGLFGKIGEAVKYGAQKSVLGASQLAGQMQAAGGMLGTSRGGMVPSYSPRREMTRDDAAQAAADSSQAAMQARSQFESRTGGGIIPSIVSEAVDPANWIGGGLASGVPMAQGLGRFGTAALRGMAAAAPAAALRPTDPNQSRLANAAMETGLGGIGGAAFQGVSEAIPAIGRRMFGGRASQPAQPTNALAVASDAAPTTTGQGFYSVPPPLPSITPSAEYTMVGELAKKASGKGIGAKAAKERLAGLAAVNPEARAAAEKLGMNLPADVFSDSHIVKEAAGGSRSIFGSEPAAAWKDMVSEASSRADEALRNMDAAYMDGTTSPAMVSQKVRENVTGTIKTLDTQASQLYSAAEEFLPLNSKPAMSNLARTLDELSGELGGRLSAQENRLLAELQNGMTYGLLKREKDAIGAAIGRSPSPYADMQKGTLKRLYSAIAEDQVEHAAAMGGDDLRSMVRSANQLTAKKKGLEQRLLKTFQDVESGSIATKMVSSIKSAAKGDTKGFEELLKVVPDELKKETLATALAASSRSARAVDKGTFGFTEFAKTYRGIMANPQVHKKLIDIMGPEADDMLRALHTVSQRMSEAQANVLTTGKANQALLNAMAGETIAERLLDSTVAKGTATAIAAVGGGPLAAGATSALTTALSGGKREPLRAIGNLFNSEEFKRLAVEAATKPTASRMSVERLAYSPKFQKFADSIGLKKGLGSRANWLNNLVKGAYMTTQQDDENATIAQY